jgi:site-specific recombinase XerD
MQALLVTDQLKEEAIWQWSEAARLWLEAVEHRRGSQRSRKEYERNLALFFGWVGKAPDQVTGADCQRWISEMQEAGLSAATINTRLAAVSSFYKFCSSRFEIAPGQYLHHFNPATVVTRLHVNPYAKAQGLSADQVRALLKACDRSTIQGLRDFALIQLFVFTGRRRAEIARLVWSDFRPGGEMGAMEYHYTGKGGKVGWRELPPVCWKAIEQYLKADNRLDTMKPDSPIFVGHTACAKRLARVESGNEALSERSINHLLDQAAKRAGLDHVKPHMLRHTASKLRRKAGDSLEQVSSMLDHSSLAITQIYLNSLEAKTDLSWQKVEALIGL